MRQSEDVGASQATGLSQAEPVARLGPSGFDPSRWMRDRICQLELENAKLRDQLGVARYTARQRGADSIRKEADELLGHFSPEWEPLRDIAARQGKGNSASQLASRARDLASRGLVEPLWAGSITMWRLSAIATEARRAETVQQGSVHEGAGPQDIAQRIIPCQPITLIYQ